MIIKAGSKILIKRAYAFRDKALKKKGLKIYSRRIWKYFTYKKNYMNIYNRLEKLLVDWDFAEIEANFDNIMEEAMDLLNKTDINSEAGEYRAKEKTE